MISAEMKEPSDPTTAGCFYPIRALREAVRLKGDGPAPLPAPLSAAPVSELWDSLWLFLGR